MTTFGELITGRLHTAYAEVADAVFSLGYFDDVNHRKQVGEAIGHTLDVFDAELRQRGLWDIEVADEHAAVVVAKAMGRMIDGMEQQIGRKFSDDEVDGIVDKAMVSRQKLERSGDVDLWGSGGRTGTEPMDTQSSGRHNPTSPMGYNDKEGHPDYQYSRPLEDEDRLKAVVGKSSLGMDEGEDMGRDDPTVFEDGPMPADAREGMSAEDTDGSTADPAVVGKEQIDRPVSLEVSDTFEDAPGVDVKKVKRQPTLDAQEDMDTRGASVDPLSLSVGETDAVAMSRLHRTMFRRAIRDRTFDLAVVRRSKDGKVEIVGESLEG